MNLVNRFQEHLPYWLQPNYPLFGAQFGGARLLVLSGRRKKGQLHNLKGGQVELQQRILERFFLEPDETGIDWLAVIWPTLDAMRNGSKNISILLPDSLAKTSILHFDSLPKNHNDIAQLIRFRLQKNTSFRTEDARVSFQIVEKRPGGACELLTILIPEKPLIALEAEFARRGYLPLVVNLSGLQMLNCLTALDDAPATYCWAYWQAGFLVCAIVDHGKLNLIRNKVRQTDSGRQTDVYLEIKKTIQFFQRQTTVRLEQFPLYLFGDPDKAKVIAAAEYFDQESVKWLSAKDFGWQSEAADIVRDIDYLPLVGLLEGR